MSPVFGHGRLRLYLLKLLDESPKHGYEIIQQLKERFAGLYAPSAGTVYPRLARMEREGLVRHTVDGGRKVYRITDAGREELTRRGGELAELENEIMASVDTLANEIRDEVKESARHVREELREETRQVRREYAREFHRERASRGQRPADEGEWAEWGRSQGEAWKNWQRAWKQQWETQWKEQWQEELSRWRQSGWAAAFGQGPQSGQRQRPHGRDSAGAHPGGAVTGQLESMIGRFGDELRAMVFEAIGNAPVDVEQLDAAREVLNNTVRDLRRIFGQR